MQATLPTGSPQNFWPSLEHCAICAPQSAPAAWACNTTAKTTSNPSVRSIVDLRGS
jgi:hypothetical protein